MDATDDKPEMTSPLADARQTPLGALSAAETLGRLRPATKGNVPVAAFNSSL